MPSLYTLTGGFLLAAYYQVSAPSPAHAYFDPSTGAYIMQMIFGFGAAVWLAFRSFLNKHGKKVETPSLPEKDSSEKESTDS